MSKKFSDILTASPETLEASVALPPGVYGFTVIKASVEELPFDFGDHEKGDENLMIFAKPTTVVEVDEDELEACENWRDNVVSLRIFPEEMGDKFCDVKTGRGFSYHCGLDPEDYENIEALILATVGQSFQGVIAHSPNKNDPERPYVNLKQTAEL